MRSATAIRGRGTLLVLCLLNLLLPATASAADDERFDHGPWDALLQSHVVYLDGGTASQVDYMGFARDSGRLTAYLDALSAVSRARFDGWPAEEQLAFLINAYNAWTIQLILTRYPDLQSIRDLGSLFNSPWKREFIPLLEAVRSLDDIEHKLIRGSGRYREPRIHLAVNCASIGCPALRREAFRAADLDRQLETATRQFLRDRSRNRLRGDTLEVSSIFRWYRDDFEQGWRGADSLPEFLALYADALAIPPGRTAELGAGRIDIRFLKYDWTLNDTPAKPAG